MAANSHAQVRKHQAERAARVQEIADAATRTIECGAVTNHSAFFATLRERLHAHGFVVRVTWNADRMGVNFVYEPEIETSLRVVI